MRLSILSVGCGLGLGLVCGVATCYAQSEVKSGHGRTLELSEPTSREAITNLNQLTGRSGLQDLEDELTKSLQNFTGRGSLDGVLAPQYPSPPPRVIVRSQKLKDELERRKNWMYLSPDDLMPGMDDADLPELLKLTGQTDEKKKQTPLEQFYQRLEREQKDFAKTRAEHDANPLNTDDRLPDDSNAPDFSKLPGAIRQSAQSLAQLLGDTQSVVTATSSRSGLWDLFGLGEKPTLTKEDIEKHKAYMEEYRKVLESSVLPVTSALDTMKTESATPTTPSPYSSSFALPNTVTLPVTLPPIQSGTESTLSTVGTVATPQLLPNQNGVVLNQWNPFYDPQPKVEVSKSGPTSVAMPEAPRRRF